MAVAALAVMLSGCGLVAPTITEDPVEPFPTIEIGTDGSPASELIAAVYVAALQANGDQAIVVEVVPGTESLALADNSPMAMPVFAGTLLWEETSQPLPMEPATTISDLATAVAPAVGILQTVKLDGGLVWAVLPDSGLSSLLDLAELPAGSAVAAPEFAMTLPSGVPALPAAYDANLIAEQIDDPSARAEALTAGDVVAALFRRTDIVELDGLTLLDDPVGILAPDPVAVALSDEFAEQRPDAVLVLDTVQAVLHEESFAELVAAAAADGVGPAIAEWLATRRLA